MHVQRVGIGTTQSSFFPFLTLGVAKRSTRAPYQPQLGLGVAGTNVLKLVHYAVAGSSVVAGTKSGCKLGTER